MYFFKILAANLCASRKKKKGCCENFGKKLWHKRRRFSSATKRQSFDFNTCIYADLCTLSREAAEGFWLKAKGGDRDAVEIFNASAACFSRLYRAQSCVLRVMSGTAYTLFSHEMMNVFRHIYCVFCVIKRQVIDGLHDPLQEKLRLCKFLFNFLQAKIIAKQIFCKLWTNVNN